MCGQGGCIESLTTAVNAEVSRGDARPGEQRATRKLGGKAGGGGVGPRRAEPREERTPGLPRLPPGSLLTTKPVSTGHCCH